MLHICEVKTMVVTQKQAGESAPVHTSDITVSSTATGRDFSAVFSSAMENHCNVFGPCRGVFILFVSLGG